MLRRDMQTQTKYVIGVDFGSDSVRCLIVGTADGAEIASAVAAYPRWKERLYCDPSLNRYRQHPLDYIESLEQCVRSALEKCGKEVADNICGISFETPPPAAAPQSLFVKTEYRLRQIGFDSILYIEGLKDYVKIHVEEETHPVLTLTSLKSLEEQLPADRFVRVHRSFIVQPSKIRSIERNRIVFGKEYIPVSENYRQAFFDFLAEHSLLF